MDIKKKKQLYEEYHIQTSVQRQLISGKNFTYNNILPIVNKYLKKEASVLDIGCGAGTLCLYYANKSKSVLGIDISQKAVKSAVASAEVLGLENVTFEKVNFPEEAPKGTFDIIFLTEVIEHLDDDKIALEKIYSLLKPKGIVIISTPSYNAPLHRLGLTKEFDKRVGHVRRYDVDELVNKCKQAGLNIVEIKKSEGVVRNFMFINPIAGKMIRFIKFGMVDIVTFIDNISLKIFGESDILVVARKR